MLRVYKKNETIVRDGDRVNFLFKIESGIVAVYHSHRESIVDVLANQYLAENEYCSQTFFQGWAIALTEAKITLSSQKRDCCDRIESFEGKEQKLSELVALSTVDPALYRVVLGLSWFVRAASLPIEDGKVRMPVAAPVIADLVGLTRETVSRQISELKKLGICDRGEDGFVLDWGKILAFR
jgi:CRP-like cAMP-binding protein